MSKLIFTILVFGFVFSSYNVKSENLKRVVNLEGTWRFTIGDNPSWSDPDYNDHNWDYVYVPQSWESAGYDNYDGFAWYRKQFQLDNKLDFENLYLVLGYIDDVDEVYLNGKLIGRSGIFPPKVTTSFRVLRKYPLPAELLNKDGNNVIAIRVFDEYKDGGIYNSPIGIFIDQERELLVNNLAGYWNILTETDNTGEPDIYGQNAGTVYIPGYLQSRGYAISDYHMLFSKEFTFTNDKAKDDLILVLGYIDFEEKVFLNDILIGTFEENINYQNNNFPKSSLLRGYNIPAGVLVVGVNTIKIEKIDNSVSDGIYEGPIGIIKNENFELLKNHPKVQPINTWEQFLKSIFE